AEEVDDGVLDAQRGEVQAAQRRAAPRDVHPQRLARSEPGAPVDRAGDQVELVLVAVRGVGNTQQDARGGARPQVRPVGEAEVALERYAATGGRRGCAERAQFEREGFLQPVRAGGMEREEGARREPQRPVSGQARDPAGRDGPGPKSPRRAAGTRAPRRPRRRSEEHTSELQSRENLVCRLLLEKKK